MALDFGRLLQSRQELAVLQERNQLARDLHDSVKQQITAASFQIGAAKRLMATDLPAALACLEEAEGLNHAAHQELNGIIFELRPVELEGGSLAQAVRDYAARWASQHQVRLQMQVEELWNPDARIQENIFRFLQEALSNIARHSHATEVILSLAECKDQPEMELSIQDNGCGFETGHPSKIGFGLTTMRTRIEQSGGRFSLESRPDHGTRVSARFPQQEIHR